MYSHWIEDVCVYAHVCVCVCVCVCGRMSVKGGGKNQAATPPATGCPQSPRVPRQDLNLSFTFLAAGGGGAGEQSVGLGLLFSWEGHQSWGREGEICTSS